jgi:hypothetical protein
MTAVRFPVLRTLASSQAGRPVPAPAGPAIPAAVPGATAQTRSPGTAAVPGATAVLAPAARRPATPQTFPAAFPRGPPLARIGGTATAKMVRPSPGCARGPGTIPGLVAAPVTASTTPAAGTALPTLGGMFLRRPGGLRNG